MDGRYLKLANLFSENELLTIERALEALSKDPPNYADEGMMEKVRSLHELVTDTRRWRHHFGKTDRRG